MEIIWETEDGYVGSGRQSFDIDDEEILECDSVDHAMKLIEDQTEEDFRQKVSWCYRDEGSIRAEVEKLFANKPKED